jgi:hypothetical protein
MYFWQEQTKPIFQENNNPLRWETRSVLSWMCVDRWVRYPMVEHNILYYSRMIAQGITLSIIYLQKIVSLYVSRLCKLYFSNKRKTWLKNKEVTKEANIWAKSSLNIWQTTIFTTILPIFSPEQNGSAERENQTLVECVRTYNDPYKRAKPTVVGRSNIDSCLFVKLLGFKDSWYSWKDPV